MRRHCEGQLGSYKQNHAAFLYNRCHSFHSTTSASARSMSMGTHFCSCTSPATLMQAMQATQGILYRKPCNTRAFDPGSTSSSSPHSLNHSHTAASPSTRTLDLPRNEPGVAIITPVTTALKILATPVFLRIAPGRLPISKVYIAVVRLI